MKILDETCRPARVAMEAQTAGMEATATTTTTMKKTPR
jgi:hypothetical protein